jgi:hypothetical protein
MTTHASAPSFPVPSHDTATNATASHLHLSHPEGAAIEVVNLSFTSLGLYQAGRNYAVGSEEHLPIPRNRKRRLKLHDGILAD